MGGGGFVTGIITCPTEKNLIYARTDVGGAYRWDENTRSWISLLDWTTNAQWTLLGVESLAVDPQAPNKVYMSCGLYNNSPSTIIRSTDYGKTFKLSSDAFPQINGNGNGRQNGERLAVDPNKGSVLFCGFRDGTLYRSPNSGANWSQVTTFGKATTSNGNGVCVVAFDKSSGVSGTATPRIFVGVSRTGADNLFVSEDAGATWKAVAGAITHLMPQRFTVVDGKLYIAYADKEGPGNAAIGAIKKYDIATSAWSDISPSNLPFGAIAVDKSNPNVLMATTINVYQWQGWTTTTQWGDRMYRSVDGGKSWTELFNNGKIQLSPFETWNPDISLHWAGSLEIDPFNPERVFVVSGNGLYITENISASTTGKSTWNFQVKGIEETVPFGIVSMPNGTYATVIGDYGGFIHSDLTAVPKGYTDGGGTNISLVMAEKKPSYLARSTTRIFYSTNYGKNWSQMNNPTGITSKHGMLAVSNLGNILLYSSTDTLYKTTNNGATWSRLPNFIKHTFIAPDPVVNEKFYVYDAGNGKFMTTTDGGSSFTTTNSSLPTGGSNIIRAVPGREGDVWIPMALGGLYRTTNSGSSFTKIANVIQCSAIGFGKESPGNSFPTIYMYGKITGGTSYLSVYRSTDEGATWTRINDDANQFGGLGNAQFIVGDMYNFGRVFMSTAGRGVIYGDPVATSGIGETIENCSSVLKVAENPFSDEIRFSTTEPTRFALYDTTGHVVETGECLQNATAGRDVRPGIYLLSVTTGKGVKSTLKILKIRK